jgi:alpha/beta superfamily hydrolase
MEEIIQFDSEGLALEGLLGKNSEAKGVVVTHPHPLYGGDMYNNVVEWITNVYQAHGYTTFRFNFRGVGNSQGRYDNGMGEQTDVLSAISTLKDKGLKCVDLAGYSFGSWINARVASTETMVDRLIMVSPPVGFINFDLIEELMPLKLVVTGSMDDIAPANIIREKLIVWNKNARLEVIEGADHFYSGYGKELELIFSSVL